MKLSVLTVTYNNANKLKEIYESLLINIKYPLDVEWVIMDDGSSDDTNDIVEEFGKEGYLNIRYFYQENQGNAIAINKLVKYARGNLILTCNPDDYLSSNAFEIINEKAKIFDKDDNIYALVFLKCDMYGEVSGKEFKQDGYKTKMFDLNYKDDIKGEKVFLFNAKIRKQFKYELEANEKYVEESRMLHKMDISYNLLCFNIPLIIGDIKNINNSTNIFIENPLRIS